MNTAQVIALVILAPIIAILMLIAMAIVALISLLGGEYLIEKLELFLFNLFTRSR